MTVHSLHENSENIPEFQRDIAQQWHFSHQYLKFIRAFLPSFTPG